MEEMDQLFCNRFYTKIHPTIVRSYADSNYKSNMNRGAYKQIFALYRKNIH